MSLTVDVPPEVEAQLEAEAKRRGQSADEHTSALMAALRQAAREFLSQESREGTTEASGTGDETYRRFFLPRLAPFFPPHWLERQDSEAALAREFLTQFAALFVTGAGASASKQTPLHVQFTVSGLPAHQRVSEANAEATLLPHRSSLADTWFERAEQQVRDLSSARLSTDAAMELVEASRGPGYLTREQFERYRSVLDDWDSGLAPEGRWKKGPVRLSEPESNILLLFRSADLVSPGGVQTQTGVPRAVQVAWVQGGYVRAFDVKGEVYASLLDVRRHADAVGAAARAKGPAQSSGAAQDGEAHTEPVMLDRMLAGRTGVIHSTGGRGGSRLSENTGAAFADYVEQKQREGRL